MKIWHVYLKIFFRIIVDYLIEAKIFDFIALVQLNSLEVLQFAQIPKSDAGIVSGRGQVVTVLGE